ncbi:MAG: DUF1616 domain-containing protein [Candidatus Bathyarchaeia archaeon]
MPKKRLNQITLDQSILHIVKSNNPATVGELVKLIQLKHPLSEQEIIQRILKLESQGKLNLKENPSPPPTTIIGYLLSPQANWYWITIILALTTTVLVFTIPDDAYPLVYARQVLGSVFVLWLPGYSFIKALFPTKVPIPTGKRELDNIERIALSLGMSLALVPLTGLLLNYTPWGIRVTPITLSLLALTVAFATIAIIREHQNQTSTQ